MKHLIKIESTAHGVLGVSHAGLDQQYCEAGEQVSLKWQPDAKWGLQEAHYTDGDGNVTAIDLTPVKIDGKDVVVFTMPAENITIGGTFKKFVLQDWTEGITPSTNGVLIVGENGEPTPVNGLITSGDIVYPKNMLDVNDPDFLEGYYLNINGVAQPGSYNTSGYIPLQENTPYYLMHSGDFTTRREMRFVHYYDSNKQKVASTQNVNFIHLPSDATYVRISYTKSATNPILFCGVNPTEYSSYFKPYTPLSLDGNGLKDKSVTYEKLAYEGRENPTSALKATGTIGTGETLNTSSLNISANNFISAVIIGAVTDVKIGISNATYGKSLQLTATNLLLLKADGTTANTYTHGLTLGNRTTITILKGWGTTATARVFDDDGNYFEQEVSWGVVTGQPYITNNGSTDLDVTLSFTPRGLREKTWIIGDSYVSYDDSARWMTYLVTDNLTNFLLVARGGMSATEGLSQLQTLLSTGACPRFLVWTLGMNGANDIGIYANWDYVSTVESVAELCKEYGIELILSTIPTVTNRAHNGMNDWVRSSGFRYIDFAAAVEESGTTTWKNWGNADAMLSSDEVHPTSYGAKALLSAVFSYFPEIALDL